jgi:hypothetical protein
MWWHHSTGRVHRVGRLWKRIRQSVVALLLLIGQGAQGSVRCKEKKHGLSKMSMTCFVPFKECSYTVSGRTFFKWKWSLPHFVNFSQFYIHVVLNTAKTWKGRRHQFLIDWLTYCCQVFPPEMKRRGTKTWTDFQRMIWESSPRKCAFRSHERAISPFPKTLAGGGGISPLFEEILLR